MGEVYTIDGAHITTIRDGTVELTQIAEMGAEGVGTLVIDDTAGTQAVVGQTSVAATQSSCANTHTYGGFVDDIEIERGSERAPNVAAARAITVQTTDLNNYLSQTGITESDGNRPAETIDERMDWLTTSDYWPAAVAVGSRVASSDFELTRSDYRQQQPGDVLSDLAPNVGFNYYVADWGSGPELTFRNDNTSTDDTSAVRISNVSTDVDSGPETLGAAKTFAPSIDFKLNRSPREKYSKISGSYAKGTVTDEDTSTEVNGERYGTASNSNVKTVAAAADWVTKLLEVHATDRDFLEGSIIVPDSAVNLLRQGERCQVKFSHMGNTGGRDYDEWTWVRVMERTVVPIVADAGIYELRLRLSPQEVAPEPDICSDLYSPTPSGTYYALGGVNGFGSHPFGSDGVVYYWRAGYTYPMVPTPGLMGSWHFGLWEGGGFGTTDYAGDCAQNYLFLMTVGNGTWSIQTKKYQAFNRRLYIDAGPPGGLTSSIVPFAVDAGALVEVTIADAVDGDCIRVVKITDSGQACGGKWGFSSATWTAA